MIWVGLCLLAFIAGFGGGYRLHMRHSIDYKARWLEANHLLQEEKVKTGTLDEIGAPATTPHSQRFKVKAEKRGNYTYIKLLEGRECVWESNSIRNGDVNFAYWVEDYTDQAKKVMKSLSKVNA